jgi:predicted O-methyltransferase YrrM
VCWPGSPLPADASYLELGFGQGLSTTIHAACGAGSFWGTDFNPQQVAQASALARGAGLPMTLLEESFEEMAARDDLPRFDIIVLHGIWSWVSAANRHHIVEIIRKNLAVGGVVYISYNCFPGWAPMLPVRHLMALHADHASTGFTSAADRIRGAIGFVNTLAQTGAGYFENNPQLVRSLETMKSHDINYVGHEFFNRDWDITHFAQVSDHLQAAKLDFAGSARLLDHLDDVHLKPETLTLLKSIPNPVLRQSARDCLINQRFRQDLFTKGAPRLSPLERRQHCLAARFVMMTPPDAMPRMIETALGEMTLPVDLMEPIIEAFAADPYEGATLGEMMQRPPLAGKDFKAVLSLLILLSGHGHVQIAQQADTAVEAQCRALNRFICQRATLSTDIGHLASPRLGGGVAVNRFEQMLILAQYHGRKTIEDQAAFVDAIFEDSGETLLKGNRPVPPGERLASFRAMADNLWSQRRGQLNGLGVLPQV